MLPDFECSMHIRDGRINRYAVSGGFVLFTLLFVIQQFGAENEQQTDQFFRFVHGDEYSPVRFSIIRSVAVLWLVQLLVFPVSLRI